MRKLVARQAGFRRNVHPGAQREALQEHCGVSRTAALKTPQRSIAAVTESVRSRVRGSVGRYTAGERKGRRRETEQANR